ncbi:Glycine cleavage system transcriptional activator [Methylobacterium crusticola]|uniref:Glycine cleavage system transcriptional activator n=1 Tax=Methylobacterium crusticola TaxID=1697972 RepID=A0ABQ4R8H5_9HYPH|nr:LysR family transcriptional regulator [Methylobacterium crusticola]GJD53076.1 Glycine cleavage system transcriptional activator [Methylobacterium crusticola]
MTHFARLIPSARGLLVFEAAARRNSFTAAAQEFNISQPSVSRNIARLEDEIGVALFDRKPRGLELTAEGHELVQAVREGFERIADTLAQLRSRRHPPRTVVTLSLSSSFVAHWLLPRLAAFNAAFPAVELRFDLIPGLLRGIPDNVDLATRIMPDDGQYHRWDLAPEIIVPVCSPSYLRARGALDQDGDWGGHVFLHLTEHPMRLWGKGPGSAADRRARPGVWHAFSDYAVILQAALNGEGIALGWVSVVSTALVSGTLVPASARRIRTGRHHTLLAPKSRPLRPAVVDIAHWFTARAADELSRLEHLL